MSNSNSPLVCYTKISPNRNPQPSKNIKYVAIHCVVGQCLIESLGALFALPSKQASSNYGVDKDGRIGMFVEEKDISWCTNSSDLVDKYGISIEVASDMSEPFAVRNEAYTALLDLLEDICRRNGKKKMLWFGDKEKSIAYQPKADEVVMMVHRWFNSGKSCPGTYLYNLHPTIAKEINKRLGSVPEPTPTPTPTPVGIKKGDAVKIKQGATYTNGKAIPNLILAETWIVEDVKGNIVRINKSIKNGWAINSTVDQKYLTVVGKTFEPYIIRVEVDALNIRLAPSTLATVVGTIRDRGAYTIVADEDGLGATRWGKLKSGAGWVSLDYCKFVRKVQE